MDGTHYGRNTLKIKEAQKNIQIYIHLLLLIYLYYIGVEPRSRMAVVGWHGVVSYREGAVHIPRKLHVGKVNLAPAAACPPRVPPSASFAGG
jgi:hypothetical protein